MPKINCRRQVLVSKNPGEPGRSGQKVGKESGKPLQAVCQELPLHEPEELFRHVKRLVPQEQTSLRNEIAFLIILLSTFYVQLSRRFAVLLSTHS